MIDFAMFVRGARLHSMVLAVAFASFAAHAQQTTVPLQSPRLGADASSPGFGNSNPRDPDQSRMIREMSRDRNELRQKEIVADTEHLLDLAKQLKDAVDKSSKDQLSLSVVNEAAEIEKLAKLVKEKMRDGQ
jgi:hypothetical protein